MSIFENEIFQVIVIFLVLVIVLVGCIWLIVDHINFNKKWRDRFWSSC